MLLSLTPWCSTLRTIFLLELFQVLVQSISEQNLTSAALSALHLHDHLSSGHFDLLVFHALASLFHLVNLFLVTRFFSLTLLPFLVSDFRHDLHLCFGLLLLFVYLALLMFFNLLLVAVSLLLNQA